jgi:hypothetical protein
MIKLNKTVIRNTFALMLLGIVSLNSHARTVMTVVCDEPNGSRLDFYAGEFREDQDGFAGIKPKFIFSDKKAQYATVLLEPADLAKKLGFKKTTNLFKIILQDSEQITMVAPTDTHLAQMYSIFPKKGIGYFSIHRYNPVQNGEATNATLSTKCKVLPNLDKK